MADASFFLLGLLLGTLATWLLLRTAFSNQLADGQARSHAAELIMEELRKQLDRRDKELTELRARVEQDRQATTEAQTRLQAAQQNLEEQKKLLEEAGTRLTDTFKALSADALKTSNQEFLTLAKQSLEAVLNEAKGDISKGQEAIGSLAQPLHEVLKRYEEQISDLEENRQKEISELGKQLYDRMRTLADHFAELGTSLEKTVKAYNQALGSLESRVFVTAGRFKDLGAPSGEQIPMLEPVDQAPRVLGEPDGQGNPTTRHE